jgi:hypothetical protein
MTGTTPQKTSRRVRDKKSATDPVVPAESTVNVDMVGPAAPACVAVAEFEVSGVPDSRRPQAHAGPETERRNDDAPGIGDAVDVVGNVAPDVIV